jgi:hypothetical protein
MRVAERARHELMTSTAPLGRSRYWVSGFPELLAEWDHERNGLLTPEEVPSGSGRMIWWRCPAGPDHAWKAKPNNRTRGAGCPFCANKKVSVTNSLATRFPEVADEWHPDLNGLTTPAEVIASSSRVCWWRCTASPPHEWRASVRDRTRALSGCPYCAHRRASAGLSLAHQYPEIARDWHPTLNGALSPEQVVPGSSRVVVWRCQSSPGHVWRASVTNRVRRASGCPHCARSSKKTTEPRNPS